MPAKHRWKGMLRNWGIKSQKRDYNKKTFQKGIKTLKQPVLEILVWISTVSLEKISSRRQWTNWCNFSLLLCASNASTIMLAHFLLLCGSRIPSFRLFLLCFVFGSVDHRPPRGPTCCASVGDLFSFFKRYRLKLWRVFSNSWRSVLLTRWIFWLETLKQRTRASPKTMCCLQYRRRFRHMSFIIFT